MAAKYAEIGKAGKFEQVFNKFPLFKISEIFTILLWNIINLRSMKKNKKMY